MSNWHNSSSSVLSRGWGRHAPTRSLGKLARVWEVKSRIDRKFSRIEKLWPRDGSCPLPLRSKRIFNKCFRIVKTQKISRGDSAHVMGSPFGPNEVPAPVLQRRCLARSRKVWGYGTVSRSDGSWNFQGMASQKRKIPPTQRSDDFVGWIGGKMNQVCCGAVNLSGIIHGEAVFKMNTTTSCGWLVTNPQEQWDLQEKYHCMWKSSRGFWKIYGNKVERVGLLTAYFGFKWIKTVSGLFLRSGRCR